MKALWWFKENEIAGMARPGFNCTPWFDFSFEEAVLVGWIGQHPSGHTSLGDFLSHVQSYGGKILRFYDLSEEAKREALAVFSRRDGLARIFRGLVSRSQLLERFELSEDQLHFSFCRKRLQWEIGQLKESGIGKVVSLTERHHDKDALQEHFDAFHFSINDLDAPSLEQITQLAEILIAAKREKKKVAVHCLAGIGRTSTMLIGAHMRMGESLESLKERIARQNPRFVFAGRQAEFIHSLSERMGNRSG